LRLFQNLAGRKSEDRMAAGRSEWARRVPALLVNFVGIDHRRRVVQHALVVSGLGEETKKKQEEKRREEKGEKERERGVEQEREETKKSKKRGRRGEERRRK